MSAKYLLAALITVSFAGHAMAQSSGNQKFTVSVPTSITITPPSDVSITHDQSDNNQNFPAQQWVVRGNTMSGVTVSFATGSAFVHATDSSFKRNAQLDLSVASSQGPAAWTVTQATDVTDYVNNDGTASVQATSNGVGKATFNLAVKFITDNFGTFAAGNYESTITGTVTAN